MAPPTNTNTNAHVASQPQPPPEPAQVQAQGEIAMPPDDNNTTNNNNGGGTGGGSKITRLLKATVRPGASRTASTNAVDTNNSTKAGKAKKMRSVVGRGVRVKGVTGGKTGRELAPLPGENPVCAVRVQVVGCEGLVAKDRNGFSDPYCVLSILNSRHSTPAAKRTLSPSYAAKDATFDFPLYLSLAERAGLEMVVWDKDMMGLKKEYMGELYVGVEDWVAGGRKGALGFDDAANQPQKFHMTSTRPHTQSQGTALLKIGLVKANENDEADLGEIYRELVKRSRRARPSLVNGAPTRGVGTIRSHQRPGATPMNALPESETSNLALQDDGGLSSDSDSDSESDSSSSDDSDDEASESDAVEPPLTATPPSTADIKTPELTLHPASPVSASQATTPRATPLVSPVSTEVEPPTPKKDDAKKKGKLPRFPRPLSRKNSANTSDLSMSSGTPGVGTPGTEERKRLGFGRRSRPSSSSGIDSPPAGASDVEGNAKKAQGYTLGSAGSNDIVGIVLLEVGKAEDLPRLRNMTRTGWDMDPFVVVSFGKKVFRTRVIRHSRSPVWDEKLLFHVRKYEKTFKIALTILDWDKLSSNDHVGDASFPVAELVDSAAQPDPVTGLYKDDEEEGEMKEFTLSLSTGKDLAWEAKHNSTITFKAKYQPYAALRQRFWRQYLKQYDTDDTRTISHLELTSMLDSLGSTLTKSTVNSFFTRHNKKPHEDDLTFDEAIIALETELHRPDSEKKRVSENDDTAGLEGETSVAATPVLSVMDGAGREVKLDQLDFSGPPMSVRGRGETEGTNHELGDVAAGAPHNERRGESWGSSGTSSSAEEVEEASEASQSGTMLQPPGGTTAGGAPAPIVSPGKAKKGRFRRKKKHGVESSSGSGSGSGSGSSGESGDPFERVINVKNCPLCHRPRMNSKAEVDIVTHLAVCASADWNKVDRIVVGNFVTASQAQRKWYTKVIGKIGAGDYKLGANSANIIVQNRMTGSLEEEKMQVYVRLGIRLLYKGMKSRMEGGRARRLLKNMSIKQGIKYDSPESAKDIPTFIEFHGLDRSEILEPLENFKNFNQFFYRKLKPDARPVEELSNPARIVSAADCRFMAFSTVSEATKIWIKGREFTVPRLLGPEYASEAHKYEGGALAIFRLAPQDYHRFHSPVDGRVGKMTYIPGEYYTVNPQAIRTALDVYGDNARKIVPFDSPTFGRVMAVCIGAMMVGTIQTTVEEGEEVKRGQEFGYFAFGGSTIVVLLEKGVVEWDEDLLINGRASLETLVRVGMGIGRGTRA